MIFLIRKSKHLSKQPDDILCNPEQSQTNDRHEKSYNYANITGFSSNKPPATARFLSQRMAQYTRGVWFNLNNYRFRTQWRSVCVSLAHLYLYSVQPNKITCKIIQIKDPEGSTLDICFTRQQGPVLWSPCALLKLDFLWMNAFVALH